MEIEEELEEGVRMILRFGIVNGRNFVFFIEIGSKKDWEGKDEFLLG